MLGFREELRRVGLLRLGSSASHRKIIPQVVARQIVVSVLLPAVVHFAQNSDSRRHSVRGKTGQGDAVELRIYAAVHSQSVLSVGETTMVAQPLVNTRAVRKWQPWDREKQQRTEKAGNRDEFHCCRSRTEEPRKWAEDAGLWGEGNGEVGN